MLIIPVIHVTCNKNTWFINLVHHINIILFMVQYYEYEKCLIPQEEEQKLKFAKKLAEFGISLPRYEHILQQQEICKLIITLFDVMCL